MRTTALLLLGLRVVCSHLMLLNPLSLSFAGDLSGITSPSCSLSHSGRLCVIQSSSVKTNKTKTEIDTWIKTSIDALQRFKDSRTNMTEMDYLLQLDAIQTEIIELEYGKLGTTIDRARDDGTLVELEPTTNFTVVLSGGEISTVDSGEHLSIVISPRTNSCFDMNETFSLGRWPWRSDAKKVEIVSVQVDQRWACGDCTLAAGVFSTENGTLLVASCSRVLLGNISTTDPMEEQTGIESRIEIVIALAAVAGVALVALAVCCIVEIRRRKLRKIFNIQPTAIKTISSPSALNTGGSSGANSVESTPTYRQREISRPLSPHDVSFDLNSANKSPPTSVMRVTKTFPPATPIKSDQIPIELTKTPSSSSSSSDEHHLSTPRKTPTKLPVNLSVTQIPLHVTETDENLFGGAAVPEDGTAAVWMGLGEMVRKNRESVSSSDSESEIHPAAPAGSDWSSTDAPMTRRRRSKKIVFIENGSVSGHEGDGEGVNGNRSEVVNFTVVLSV